MKLPLSIIFALLGLIIHFPTQGQTTQKQIGSHMMSIGKIEAVVISDGHLVVSPVQAEFAPRTDFSLVSKTLKENFASDTEIDLAMNVLLLKIDKRKILIDAGAGEVFGNESGWLIRNLQHAGVQPSQITDVVITHAHPDHIGGLSNKDNNPIFPNADVYISKAEYDFWMSPYPNFSKSTMSNKPHLKMMVDVAKQNLHAVSKRLHLIKNDTTLFQCMAIQIVPGHTPGHINIRIYSENEELYHFADLVHSEIISLIHPEWIYNSDSDFQLGIETRQRVLAQVGVIKVMAFASHLPWPGLGHIKPEGTGYRWIQKRIVTPD